LKRETKTTGVNFINVLRTTFTLVDPKSVKIQLSHKYLFMLLGSASVKAVRITLMKSTVELLLSMLLCTIVVTL